jgi:hypothetical protein
MSKGAAPTSSTREFDVLARCWIVPAFLLTVCAVSATALWRAPRVSEVFLYLQDVPVLAACLAFWLVVPWTAQKFGWRLPEVSVSPKLAAFGVAAGAAAVALIGSLLVYRGYALSMDEFMATFDARIFQHGQLAAPVAERWRPFVDALQPIFRLKVPGNQFWTSTYLPGSAAVRGIFSSLSVPEATNAAWIAIAVLSLFSVARRLWPDRPDAAVVAIIILATSSQVLITAMTPYAMTAHLALNLAWLALFLRKTYLADAAAGAVALLACGLHQVIFHPLFAAPFLLQLWLNREWRRASYYTVAYLGFGLFWAAYWDIALQVNGVSPEASANVGGGFLIERVRELLAAFNVGGIGLMAKNLTRFVAWQNPVGVALAIFGVSSAVRSNETLRALVAGFVLTIAAMFILLPFQGHGWGYRYLHGLLGSVSLVAANGWTRLASVQPASDAAPSKALFGIASAFSLLLLLPWHAYQVTRWVAPYAEATRWINAAAADIVFVDARGLWYGNDLVRNDPFLLTSPKVLALGSLNEDQVAALCQRYRVVVFDKNVGLRLGIRASNYPRDFNEHVDKLRMLMRTMSCGER